MSDSGSELLSTEPLPVKSGQTRTRRLLKVALISLPFIGGCGVLVGFQFQQARNAALKTADK